MTLKWPGALALFLFTFVTPASAQTPWNGFYVGAHIGHGSGTANPDTPGTPSLDAKGFLGGVQFGYDYRVQNVVLGAVVDASLAHLTGFEPDGNYLSYRGKADALGTARLRAGVVLDNRLLIYATGGLAWTRNTATQQCAPALFGVCAITGPFVARDTKWANGWSAGAGFEYKLPQSPVTLGLLYLHTDYGDEMYSFTVPVAGTVTGTTRQKDNRVMLSVNIPLQAIFGH